MYPDLSYFFHDLLGSDRDNWLSIFKTFGIFLVAAILVAAWILRKDLRRREAIGQLAGQSAIVQTGIGMSNLEYLYNALFGFVVGYKFGYAFIHFAELQEDPSSVLLSLEGNWWIGLLTAIGFGLYYWWQDRPNRLAEPTEKTIQIFPSDRIGTITIVAAISGVVGAKIFALMEDIPSFLENPIRSFFSGSGLTIYGGLIGGFLVTAWYLRTKKIPILPVLDAVAPALIVAYGVGRMGCHFSGDGDWGIVAAAQPSWWFLPDWLWAYDYPNNVIQEGQALVNCVGEYCSHLVPAVYPTPVYETTAAFLIGAILWRLRKPLTYIPGLLFCIYLFFNGFERFWIEKIRVNIRYELFASLTQAEIIAISLMLIGLGMGAWLWKTHKDKQPSPEDEVTKS